LIVNKYTESSVSKLGMGFIHPMESISIPFPYLPYRISPTFVADIFQKIAYLVGNCINKKQGIKERPNK